MIKTYISTIILLCTYFLANAQTSYLKCIYAETPAVSDQVREMKDVYLRDIVVSKFKKEKKTYTMFVANNKYLFTKVSDKTNNPNMLIGAYNSIYIDKGTDSIISERTIVNKNYVIKDIAIAPRWKMTNETRIINGKKCTKAIARGLLKIEAWYTTDIPFSYGPLGYYGLPGLIIELDTPSDIYTLKSFEYLQKDPELKSIANGQVVTKTEFDKIQENYFTKYGEAKAGEVVIVEK